MRAGASEEKIRQVPTWRESRLFSEMERAALEYAERMTITGEKVTDELWARLRSHLRGADGGVDGGSGARELSQQVQRAAGRGDAGVLHSRVGIPGFAGGNATT